MCVCVCVRACVRVHVVHLHDVLILSPCRRCVWRIPTSTVVPSSKRRTPATVPRPYLHNSQVVPVKFDAQHLCSHSFLDNPCPHTISTFPWYSSPLHTLFPYHFYLHSISSFPYHPHLHSISSFPYHPCLHSTPSFPYRPCLQSIPSFPHHPRPVSIVFLHAHPQSISPSQTTSFPIPCHFSLKFLF